MNDAAMDPASVLEARADTLSAAAGLVLASIGGACLVLFSLLQLDGLRATTATVFAVALVMLHLASTLYHRESDPGRRARLKVFDHCAIYVLIAGTYTPFTLVGLGGRLGWTMFVAIWALAALGIVFKLFFTGKLRLLSTLIYVAMGWLVVFAIKPVMAALDTWTFCWLLAGGIVYTLGTVFYHRPGLRYSHAIWHGFVIGGGACHYVAVVAQLFSPS